MTLSSAPALTDAAARKKILNDLDRTFFVEAGAGTGKTSVLVARIANLIAAGRLTIDRLVAITFTEAAAAELRDRVREALERAAADPARTDDERGNCFRAVADIDLAAISTIHSFAGQLLRTYPLEAGLPPGFATLDEIQQDLLFEERFKTWFWRDALREPLRAVVKRALLLGLTQERVCQLAAALEEQHDLLGPETTWTAPEPPSALAAAAFAGDRLTQLQRSVPYALDGEQDPLIQIVLGAQSSARQLLAARSENEALSALLGVGYIRTYPPHSDRWKAALDGRNAGAVVYETLNDVSARVLRMVDAHRSESLAALLGYALPICALEGVCQRRATGTASFHDLLAWARDLLRDNASVRHAVQARYQRVFIDEFQDTDPLQAEIAVYLCAQERDGCALPPDWRDTELVPGKLFVVGDPKQSIYRFRGADIAIYDDLLQRLSDTRERLTHNFRSVRPLLDWVNHHFDVHMQAEPGFQPEYAPLAAQWPAHVGAECGVRRVGSVVGGNAAAAADAEASSFAALARSSVESRWLVSDRDPSGARILRRAQYRDICILLPARTHLRRLEHALERVGVPYRVEAGKLVLATQEVRDLLSCLRAIEDPSDQVALVAALRSPAYACSDVDLLRWVEGGGNLDHEDPRSGPDGAVRDALASLAEFHRRRLLLSPAALIEEFLADRLLVASAFAEPRPREAWRRFRYVVSRARAFTTTGRHTLRAFLDWIEGLQRAEVRDPESGSAESDEDAVHIQTVHGAKGLEYPIVLLGGLGSTSRNRSASVEVIANRRTGVLACRAGSGWQTPDFGVAQQREKQMAEAESVRLLYVAATRARDHLILSLFRGAFSESSHAAVIERRLREAAPDLCPPLDVPDYPDLEPLPTGVPAADAAPGHAAAEQVWLTHRHALAASLASPRVDPSWWSPTRPAHSLPTPVGAPARRNVTLLAQIDGVLLEERVDLVYPSEAGTVLVLPLQEQQRAARVALAFTAATGIQPAAVELVAGDGSKCKLDDVPAAIEQARADLHRPLTADTAPRA